jgi:FkbM family methyltransferase
MRLKNNLLVARRILRAIAGRDVYARSEIRAAKVHLGNEYASWCVFPSALGEHSVVYSFGVGEDISFDLGLIQRFGMQVHAFDPTPRSCKWIRTQSLPEKFVFHNFGIGPVDGSAAFYAPDNPNFVSYSVVARGAGTTEAVEAPVYSLRTIMGMLGHNRVDLLKMDIEGAEYEVIGDLVASGISVKQLLVEFHHRWPEVGVKKTKEALRALNHAGFRIFDVAPAGSEYSFLATSTL